MISSLKIVDKNYLSYIHCLFLKENLSTAEVEWFNEYNKLLADYQASLSDKGLNLMSSLLPPKELYVQVRLI